jgi:primosomal protein N' (replication factor Y)
MNTTEVYLQVALPTPLRKTFEYRAGKIPHLEVGSRVYVPFGPRKLVGIVVAIQSQPFSQNIKLKSIIECLDAEPVFSKSMLQLVEKVAGYYHHSLGETLFSALPANMRKPKALDPIQVTLLRLSPDSDIKLGRAPKQLAIINWLQQQTGQCSTLTAFTEQFPQAKQSLNALIDKKLIQRTVQDAQSTHVPCNPPASALNNEQQRAVSAVAQHLSAFKPFLLHGVTGSGKTEVYLHLSYQVLQQQGQVIVLVPEITLTPQFVARFEQCFGQDVITYHSGLSDKQRTLHWQLFKQGQRRILIGTRSAIFLPMSQPGMIIVDEEHDAAYKQQDNLKYSARDMAVMRGQFENIPVLLGSATPSFESIYNAEHQRYQLLSLPQRAAGASQPQRTIIDLKQYPPEENFSAPAIAALEKHLLRGEQVIIYLNRRGFAPVLICSQCGWQAMCHRCDRPTTYHAARKTLSCHHCGKESHVPKQCPECGNLNLAPVGFGTERVEAFLQQRFPHFGISRFDRDHIARKGELESQLARVHSNEAQILLGTQMLTKGHDFPNVTLVLVLDADQGLFGADLRSAERFIQMITQVSGRAGRGEKPGQVLIQTRHADHPLLQALLRADYMQLASSLLKERLECEMPPTVYAASIRAEANQVGPCYDFLTEVCGYLQQSGQAVELLGPAPAVMPRKAGRHRVQLLMLGQQRAALHQAINQCLPFVENLPSARKVRWALEVDPLELA